MSDRLVARTERRDLDVDLLALADEDSSLWLRGRSGFVGFGVARRIALPRDDPLAAADAVRAALADIDVDDEVGVAGTGPIALGALPFLPGEPGTLVVPAVVVGRSDDGTRFCTLVSAAGQSHDLAGDPLSEDARSEGEHERDRSVAVTDPSSYRVHSDRAPAEWCDALVAARAELRADSAEKVVLARAVDVVADAPLSRVAILARLRAAYPACMLFAADGWVGASPELLVSRHGDVVRSHPMAGTAPRNNDPAADARLAAGLLSSAKDLAEHRYTIDMVHDTLLPWCSYLDEEAEPSIVAMANVQHLATLVEGRLSSPPASVVELMVALHPTPAVCGAPREAALALIERYEDLDRGCYGGPVGWVDAEGNGEWAVGIRSAHVEGARARLFAGVGVVAESDPVTELAETRAKLQAVLSAVLRP